MSDTAPAEPEAAEVEAPDVETAPPKKPGLIRWTGVIILPVLLLLGFGLVWLFGDGWLAASVRQGVSATGLAFGEDTTIEADLFGGSIGFTSLAVDRDKDETLERLVTAPTAAIDLAVLDTVTSGDVILDRFHIGDATLVLEELAKPAPEAADETDTDTTEPDAEAKEPVDILEWWETAKTWRQRLNDWFGSDGQETTTTDENGEPERPVTFDWDDPRVAHYHPLPSADGSSRLPRLLIRDFSVDGLKAKNPIGTASGNPFDLTGGKAAGTNLTNVLLDGEHLQLTLDGVTAGAGEIHVAISKAVGNGSLKVTLPALPMPALGHPSIGGSRLANYGLGGLADVKLDTTWTKGGLAGHIDMAISDFSLQPTAEAGADAHQVAQGWQEIQKLHTKLGITEPLVLKWRITIGGDGDAPTFSGGLVDAVKGMKNELIAQAKDAAKAKLQEGRQVAVDTIKEEGKNLLQDLRDGKDPKDAGKDSGENLKDKLKGLGGGLFGK